MSHIVNFTEEIEIVLAIANHSFWFISVNSAQQVICFQDCGRIRPLIFFANVFYSIYLRVINPEGGW